MLDCISDLLTQFGALTVDDQLGSDVKSSSRGKQIRPDVKVKDPFKRGFEATEQQADAKDACSDPETTPHSQRQG